MKKKSVSLLHSAVEFLEKDLSSPELVDLYEKTIKRRAAAAKEAGDERKEAFVFSLLRHFTEKLFQQTDDEKRKHIRSIL